MTWSWLGRLALIAVPVAVYLAGLVLTEQAKEAVAAADAKPDVMTLALTLMAFVLRVGGLCLGVLSLYRLFFRSPARGAPRWMTTIKD